MRLGDKIRSRRISPGDGGVTERARLTRIGALPSLELDLHSPYPGIPDEGQEPLPLHLQAVAIRVVRPGRDLADHPDVLPTVCRNERMNHPMSLATNMLGKSGDKARVVGFFGTLVSEVQHGSLLSVGYILCLWAQLDEHRQEKEVRDQCESRRTAHVRR